MTIEVEGEVYLTPIAPSFGQVDRAFIIRVFRERSRWLAGKLSQAINDLQNESFGRRAFVRQTMEALRQAYYTIFSLGALSVDQFHVLTTEDMRILNEELFGERRFLQSFARDIGRGTLELDPELRARLYFAALRGVFELGRTSALPAGPYDWILGDTDHCEPCVQASLIGPYKKDASSLLSLPVVPGIPGTGEVCRGLTRCGCTLRLQGYPANESLQLQLRDVLESTRLEIR